MSDRRDRRSMLALQVGAVVTLAVFAAGCASSGGSRDPAPAAPSSSASLVPVGDDQGQHVGWMRLPEPAESEQDAEERVPVYDDDGELVGHFRMGTDGGFEPLDE